MRSRLAAAVLVAAALALGACDRPGGGARATFNAVDVTGVKMGEDFRLPDHEGRERSLADFRGKVVVLNFGYTQCPDVCPTTLGDLAKAVRSLGPEGERVQVLFMTVDPKRDTQPLLKEYVPAFHPSFIGLRGDAAQTAKVTKDFHIYAQERPGKTPETYTVDHSAQSLVFDPKGRLRLVIGYGMEPDKIAQDLRILLN